MRARRSERTSGPPCASGGWNKHWPHSRLAYVASNKPRASPRALVGPNSSVRLLSQIIRRISRRVRRPAPIQWEHASGADTSKAAHGRARIAAAIDGVASGCASLLDVGCGSGRLRLIARAKGLSYTGIEYGQGMARVARTAMPGVPIINASIEAIPIQSNSVDVVVAQGVIETLADYRGALAEMLRVARRVVIVTAPVADDRDIPGGFDVPHAGWTRSNACSREGVRRLGEAAGVRVIEQHLGGRGLFILLKR